jgi:hypothetical protein
MGMLNLIAWILVSVAGVYAAIGLVFALFFVTRGVTRIDPTAIGGSTGFRILILPGVVAFWPLLMRRQQESAPPPGEHNAHRDLARQPDGGAQ